MGKLKPLRKTKSVASTKSDPVDKQSRTQKDKQHIKNKKNVGSSSTSSTINTTKNAASEDDDDEEWERLEREQNEDENDSNDDSDDDDEDNDNSDDIKMEGDILSQRLQQDETTYDFEFNDIKDEYVESITVLVKTLFPNPTIAYSISQHIAQQLVGTAITCDGGDDVFAFASVIPLAGIKDGPLGLGTLLSHFRSTLHCSNGSIGSGASIKTTSKDSLLSSQFYESLKEIDASSSNSVATNVCSNIVVGLLLHRKFSNLPLPLIGPLHQNVIDDIDWLAGGNRGGKAVVDSTTSSNSSSNSSNSSSRSSSVLNNEASVGDSHNVAPIKYTHLLIFAPCSISFKFKSTLRESNASHNNNKNCTTGDDVFEVTTENYSSIKEEIVFDLFEDEIFFQHRLNHAAYLYHNADSSSNNSLSTCSKYIMFSLLKVEDYPKCVKEINALVN